MAHQQDELRELLTREGVVARAARPDLGGAMDRLLRTNDVVAVLPGVYAATERAGAWEVLVAALRLRFPDAVLVAASAAKVSYWPQLTPPVVECATRHGCEPRAGFQFRRRIVPADLVAERAGLRFTVPALTALELADTLGGDAIDHALRLRATSLPAMWEALRLTSGRRGHRGRRAILLDSRDEPWSEAERLFHRLLRSAGITGWRSNLPVRAGDRRYHLDVAFPEHRLAIEVDGRVHAQGDVFESDRHRQNALVLEGWTVLRFTWRMLVDEPEVVLATVEAALTRCR